MTSTDHDSGADPYQPTAPGPQRNQFQSRTLKKSYISLRALNLGSSVVGDGLSVGRVDVYEEGHDDIIASGSMNRDGILSGMARVHMELDLKEGSTFEFRVPAVDSNLIIVRRPPGTTPVPPHPTPRLPATATQTEAGVRANGARPHPHRTVPS